MMNKLFEYIGNKVRELDKSTMEYEEEHSTDALDDMLDNIVTEIRFQYILKCRTEFLLNIQYVREDGRSMIPIIILM